MGHLTQFQVGGGALPADLRVIPFGPQQPMQVVGVVKRVSWNGGPTDPLNVCAYVTQENAVAIRNYLRTHAPARYRLNPALPAVPRPWGPAALGVLLPGANPESC